MDGDKQNTCTNYECIHPDNWPVRYYERRTGQVSPWAYTGKAYDWKGDETGVCDDCAWTSRWPSVGVTWTT